MAKVRFYYNTESCNYERYKPTPRELFIQVGSFLLLTGVLATGLIYLYQQNFKSYKQSRLEEINQQLVLEWDILQADLSEAHGQLSELEYTDDQIYRVILDTEPIPVSIRNGGVGGHDKYEDLLKSRLDKKGLMITTYRDLDKLKRRMYIQSKSYDEISQLLHKKEKMWSARPAIQPINNKELVRIASGFMPRRFNPVLKRIMPHKGIDFTASKGTPIYATGDGKVIKVYRSASYGKVVFINHGYGYETRYAHMNEYNVKVGDRVKRGEIIGFVGNTGRSRGDHLHYEILYKGTHINPINFFQRDLSNEEYDKLIEISSSSTEVLD